jgi:hypothetical protein
MSDGALPRGNFIAEWFGFRVWPPEQMDDSDEARRHQSQRLCPFLSAATGTPTRCHKPESGIGFCTASSDSNGLREDWLACPTRLLDQRFTLLEQAVRTVYDVPAHQAVELFPVTRLADLVTRNAVLASLDGGSARVFVFTGRKLGGEVDIPETTESPGLKVDFSVAEATASGQSGPMPLQFGRVMLFEIQTADFHGSPSHAVSKLKELCPEGQNQPYHEQLRAEPGRAGEKMEGPNKANIFKRTILRLTRLPWRAV